MTRSDHRLRSERIAFYEEDLQHIERCLEEFLKLSGARCALLVDRDGHVVAQAGPRQGFDLDTVSALVAGSFAATRQMARLLGETEFNALHHEGEKESVLIHLAGDRALLTVLFDDGTTLGMVRLYTAEAAKRLDAIFQEAAERSGGEPASPFGEGFEASAKESVDELFGRGEK